MKSEMENERDMAETKLAKVNRILNPEQTRLDLEARHIAGHHNPETVPNPNPKPYYYHRRTHPQIKYAVSSKWFGPGTVSSGINTVTKSRLGLGLGLGLG